MKKLGGDVKNPGGMHTFVNIFVDLCNQSTDLY